MEIKVEPNAEVAGLIRNRIAVATEVRNAMLPEIQGRAFAVSGLEELRVVAEIQEAIARVPEGADWKKTREEIAGKLNVKPELQEHRAEMILRTNAFCAYSSARYRKQMADRDIMPFLVYHCVGDHAVRPQHRKLDGMVLPVDDPFWKTHYPPWEWGCRCTVSGMTKAEADEERAAERAQGDKAPQGSRFHFPTEAEKNRVPAPAGNYSFEPSTLAISLEELNQRKYQESAIRAFSKKMQQQRVTGFDAGTQQEVNVWDWLMRDQIRSDADVLRAEMRKERPVERIILRDADTGKKLLDELGDVDSVGSDRAGQVVDENRRQVRRYVSIHLHVQGDAVPSPEDLLPATNHNAVRDYIVSLWGSGTYKVADGKRGLPKSIRADLARFQKRLDDVSGNWFEFGIAQQDWKKWLTEHSEYFTFSIGDNNEGISL